ncbi:MAG: hypothetical protein OHK005_19150 [Candidatus Methylacidiphilales bacterium]
MAMRKEVPGVSGLSSSKNQRSGFTLVEIIVVVTVIVILMGLVLGVAGPVQESGRRSRAQAEIAGLETALTRFEQDNGFYPNATSIGTLAGDTFYNGNPANYLAASRALFLAVTGRQWLNSTDTASMGRQYMEVKPSQVPPSAVGTSSSANADAASFATYSTPLSSGSYLLDPWGRAYGYYYNANPTTTPPRYSINNVVTYDLWTTGGQTANPSAGEPHIIRKWIANWPTDF